MSDNAIGFTYRIIYKTYLIIITIMNNTIQIFENKEFGAIRTMSDQQGNPLFCGKDVAEALGYKKPENALAQHVEKGDTLKQGTPTTSGIQMMTFINESGLYSLILGSKLESARRFKHWVTSEVLPSIRKQGGYMVLGADESDEVILSMLYYPHLSYKRAVHLFRQELRQTRGLLDALKAVGYRENLRILTPRQVQVIEDFLGEP